MWTIENFAGSYAFGPSGALKIGMFELCRAVNEREYALGLPKTLWYKSDDTQSADIEIEDLVGMKLSGTDNRFTTNCERIMARIKQLITAGWFCEGTGKTEPWTIANMQADIGLSTFMDRPRFACDARFYQQCKEALDRMIHVGTKNFVDLSRSRTLEGGNSDPDTIYSTIPAAWASRYDIPLSATVSGDFSPFYCRWTVSSGSPWSASVIDRVIIPFSYDKFVPITQINNPFNSGSRKYGVLTESYAAVALNHSGGFWAYAPYDAVVDGESFIPADISGLDVQYVPIVDTPTLDSDFSIEMDFTSSTIPPSRLDPISVIYGTYTLVLNRIDMYIDIASILTDQA